MKVLKFGGTSVGSAARMQEVAKLVSGEGQKIVVLSAMSGTTNSLIEISEYLYKNNPSGTLERINVLEQQYFTTVDTLYSNIKIQKEAREIVASHFNYIRSFSKSVFTLFKEKSHTGPGRTPIHGHVSAVFAGKRRKLSTASCFKLHAYRQKYRTRYSLHQRTFEKRTRAASQ